MHRFERLQLIVNLIRSRPGIKAPELASEAGVSKRTIFRDMSYLVSRYMVSNNDGYHVVPMAFFKTPAFSEAEYSLLQLALASPALKRPDLRLAADSVRAKIDAITGWNIRASYQPNNQFSPLMSCQESDSPQFQAICGVLENAIQGRRAVDLSFDDAFEVTEDRRIQPYVLVYHHPEWLLAGFSPKSRKFELVKLDLIKGVSITSQSFQKNDNFRLDDFYAVPWGTRGNKEVKVKIRFRGTAASKVFQDRHHPKEELIKLNDREVIYSALVCSTQEISEMDSGIRRRGGSSGT